MHYLLWPAGGSPEVLLWSVDGGGTSCWNKSLWTHLSRKEPKAGSVLLLNSASSHDEHSSQPISMRPSPTSCDSLFWLVGAYLSIKVALHYSVWFLCRLAGAPEFNCGRNLIVSAVGVTATLRSFSIKQTRMIFSHLSVCLAPCFFTDLMKCVISKSSE